MAAQRRTANDIIALLREFDTDEKCLTHLEQLRWPDGPVCCKCGSILAYRIRDRRLYECGDCGHQYSVTSGTILHRTRLPLVKWIVAAALICNAAKGISAKQLSRDIGVTYKVAWSMGHRLRRAMKRSEANQSRFRGTVEVDETYIGGRAKGKRGRGAANKTIAFGAKERQSGRVKICVIPNVKRKTLHRAVAGYVSLNSKKLIADQWQGYDLLESIYNMRRIHHKSGYTKGGVHTQGIESVWALTKRQHHGTHHWISPKYLPLYLAEICFKLNNRTSKNPAAKLLKSSLQTSRLKRTL